MKQTILIIGSVIIAISTMVVAFTIFQVNREQATLVADLQYRARLLTGGLKESIEPSFAENSTSTLERIVTRLEDQERIIGLAIYDTNGQLIVSSPGLPQELATTSPLIARVMDSASPEGGFVSGRGTSRYLFAEPLRQGDRVVGALSVVQNSSYINERIQEIWLNTLARLLVQIFILSVIVWVLVRLLFFKPLTRLTESLKSARAGKPRVSESADAETSFFPALVSEVSKLSKSLVQARTAASEEARMRLEKLDSPWTAERLQEFIKAYLKDRPIYVVSNREPYIHTKEKGQVKWSVPASGMVTALEPVMAACGGTWIAHGSGNADKETADSGGKIQVPPEEPKYTLKRVWLTKEEIKGHYVGFSNEALWPLCHMAHTRPVFRKEDWIGYRKVNGKFARELLKEIKDVQRPLILVQDYHLALLPEMIHASRPDAQVALFWHVPWPSAELFSICPWRKEILRGMLGADIIGFHTQQHCNNFMDTVGKEIEALVDLEHFSITREGHVSYIKPFPISIAFTNGRNGADLSDDASQALSIDVPEGRLILGVDRLDYTKGILERFKAFEFLLDSNPEYLGSVVFLQIAPPSREAVEKYRAYNEAVTEEAERINQKFGVREWKPIHLEKRHFSHEELTTLYRRADVCLVTSLHDGMNLVAKEYVAARNDEAGVLILSQLTGAARDLKGALLVNPYSAEETAEALREALSMQPAEQHRRMKTMRETVRSYNVYRWSAELIKALSDLG